jgi:DNA-directed RNA polymerase specialized sigma24 family protein
MLAAARKILGDADAQDAVQTTLLAVWLAGTLDLSRPRAFLLTAVRRESIRMLKRLRRSGFTTPV